MTFPLALCIIGTTLIVLTFLLFLTVYFAELIREHKILKDYKRTTNTIPLLLIDQIKPVAAKPQEDKSKKNIN